MNVRLTAALTAAFFAIAVRTAIAAPITPLPAAQESYAAGSLHIDVYGTSGKPAMVLLPGLTCGPWEFGNEIAAFGSSYRIYALTLPGFDGRPPTSGKLFDTATADAWKWLADKHIEKPVVVGHSLGATLAELMATQHSERLRAVAAIDGLPVFPGTENLRAEQRAANADRMAAQTAATPKAVYANVLQTYVMPYLVTGNDDARRDAALEAKSDPIAAAAWLKEDLLLDLRPSLSHVTVPLLLVGPYDATLEGSMLKDAAAKRAYYASLVANAPHAQTVIVDRSRHFIMNDQPKALDEAIGRFLAQ